MIKLTFPLTQVDTEERYNIGTQTMDKDGNVFEYRAGVASVAQYDFCSWYSNGSVARLTTGNTGAVGIAQAAIIGPNYGWFQIKGLGAGNCAATVSGGSGLYASGTTGTVSDVYTASAFIRGITSSATGVSTGTVNVVLSYPRMEQSDI